MILQIRKVASLAGLTLSAACASVPSLPYEKGVGVVDILQAPKRVTRPAVGVPQQTQQDLSNIIRSLKQSQTGRD